MEIIFCFLVLFFAIIGLSEIIHYIQLAILDTKSKKNRIMCCILRGSEAELDLKYVIEQYNWSGRRFADKVIAVNCLQRDDPVYNSCRLTAERNNLVFVNEQELSKLVIGVNDANQREQN